MRWHRLVVACSVAPPPLQAAIASQASAAEPAAKQRPVAAVAVATASCLDLMLEPTAKQIPKIPAAVVAVVAVEV